MTTTKPTKGPLEVVFRENTIGLALVDSGKAMAVMLELADNPQAIKDAKLFAEAFNVLHETSLTPRQLDDQRRELFEALKGIEKDAQKMLYDAAADVQEGGVFRADRWLAVLSVLTKAKGEI